MKNLSQSVVDIVQSQKTAHVVATATSGTGISTILGLIPDIIGVVSMIIGITISILLWKKQKRKLELEAQYWENKLKDN
ncbi:MAG: hypothetical protein KAS32_13360 [Candidatus Peribacteraceae bacterium]|nr:hypothetical protein [Candidatus Peribacteraceae bacterium]